MLRSWNSSFLCNYLLWFKSVWLAGWMNGLALPDTCASHFTLNKNSVEVEPVSQQTWDSLEITVCFILMLTSRRKVIHSLHHPTGIWRSEYMKLSDSIHHVIRVWSKMWKFWGHRCKMLTLTLKGTAKNVTGDQCPISPFIQTEPVVTTASEVIMHECKQQPNCTPKHL